MVRSSSCEKNSVVKSSVWIADEDAKTPTFVSEHGSGNWTSVPKKTGVKRCGKSCRLRLSSYVPDLKHDNFTSEEEDLIVKLHAAIGSRWSIIAQQLPGRTDNDVKNNWNTKLKKKLSQMGIDPVTHKPFSKLIADYGNIGATTAAAATNSQQRLIRNTNDRSMQLRTKMETTMFEEGCLSSTLSTSSACSSTSTHGTTFFAPFSWNDFLIEDANFAVPTNNNLQEEQYLEKKKEVMSSSSSSDVSFVEAILGQENEMFLSFPELLEEPSNY